MGILSKVFKTKPKRAEKAAKARKGKQAKRKASRSPGGYQSGRTVNPRAAGAAAMRRNRPKRPRVRFEGPDWPRPRRSGWGDWAEGGAIETYSEQVKRKYGGGKL
jgi:hypothetical protein